MMWINIYLTLVNNLIIILMFWHGGKQMSLNIKFYWKLPKMFWPFSTISSKSAFSTGKRILDSCRSSLTSKTVEALICTQNWIGVLLDISQQVEDLEICFKIETSNSKSIYCSFVKMYYIWLHHNLYFIFQMI